MTVRYAIREIETHPGRFPAGLDTSIEDVYASQGEAFFAPPSKVWVLAIASPYSGEPPKVSIHRSFETAKAAMDVDVHETVENADSLFDPADLVRESECRIRLGDEIIWTLAQTDMRD